MPTAYHPPLKRGSILKIFNRPKDDHVTRATLSVALYARHYTECGIIRPTNAIYMGSYSLLGSKLFLST